MSWKIFDLLAQREAFVAQAVQATVSFTELCRRYDISRKTGYKWCARFRAAGPAGLQPRVGVRPRLAQQTAAQVERVVLALRRKQPTWGPRKLRRRLSDLGHIALPALSTFARILRRGGLISAPSSAAHRPVQRFARLQPNELWQMDFKGHFALQRGARCHPLTVLDDCSRYLLSLDACANEQSSTVQHCLTLAFERHGLPEAILCDNGAPWSGSGHECTGLAVWLWRLGIKVLHGRPHHPQTQGKAERFHRTLRADLLARQDWRDLVQAQQRFTRYRRLYNHERPHEALALAVPAARYAPSPRIFPGRLHAVEYAEGTCVRQVGLRGAISFSGRHYYIAQALGGLPVAVHPTATDGLHRVCFAAFSLGLIDLTRPQTAPRGSHLALQPLPANCYP
jgi:transposase InsO family protein